MQTTMDSFKARRDCFKVYCHEKKSSVAEVFHIIQVLLTCNLLVSLILQIISFPWLIVYLVYSAI